jgi:hypothetical protein
VQFIERTIDSVDWITLCLVGCVLLFSAAKLFYPRRFQEFIMLPLTNKYFLVQGRSEQIQHPFNLLLFAAQIILACLFIFITIKGFQPELIKENSWLFVQICTGYAGFIFIKFCIEKIIGAIFSIDVLINSYLYQKLTYRNLLAIVFFAACLLLSRVAEPSKPLLLVVAAVVILCNCIALFYSYKTNGRLILSNFFYFILYLCALEISPYIILYKIAV